MSAARLKTSQAEAREALAWDLEGLGAVLAAVQDCMGSDDLKHRDRAARLVALARELTKSLIDAAEAAPSAPDLARGGEARPAGEPAASGCELMPGMNCSYTIAPGAELPELMDDLALMLSAALGVMEEVSGELASANNTAGRAFWAGLYMLQQARAVASQAGTAAARVLASGPEAAQHTGGAA